MHPSARTSATLVHRHVVEHDHGGARRHRLVDLLGTVALHLDHAARATGGGPERTASVMDMPAR